MWWRPSLALLLLVASGVDPVSALTLPSHTLLLCRHGDSIWNGGQPGYVETFTGWTDVELTRKGVYEARVAGEEVSELFAYDIDVCFTSALGRAQETADFIVERFAADRGSKIPLIEDYRLNERHYGALQGLVKSDVEAGKYGHDPELVRRWRRSWHVMPPLLEDDDPRRLHELAQYADLCGGPENVPRGESLAMVAANRVRPMLDTIITPVLDAIVASHGGRPATGLVVAHANSLRALIGCICEVEDNPEALDILEALRVPTGIPLMLNFKRHSDGRYQVCSLPEADECLVEYFDGAGLAQKAPPDLGHPSLPVWPLNRCIPVRHAETQVVQPMLVARR